jgi:quercetin dioxygenase-like cupin family protein
MKIKNDADVPEKILKDEDLQDVTKKILIGTEDGSTNIIMRYFRVLPKGHTPFHSHEFEHVVRIEKGRGVIVNEAQEEIRVFPGQNVFVGGGEKHQFKNPYDKPFEFLCIIMNPARSQ